jgi:hypothetical protein
MKYVLAMLSVLLFASAVEKADARPWHGGWGWGGPYPYAYPGPYYSPVPNYSVSEVERLEGIIASLNAEIAACRRTCHR